MIQLHKIRLKGNGGTASLTSVRLFDSEGAVVLGPLSATVGSAGWVTLASALTGFDGVLSAVYGMTAVVADFPLEASFGGPGLEGADQAFAVGAAVQIGELPEGIRQSSVAIGAVAATLANLERAEDSAHASGQSGIMLLGVRRDTPSAMVSADGDYGALQLTAAGRARVAAALEQLPVVSGTLTNSGDAVVATGATGMGSGTVQLSSVTGAGPSVIMEYSLDGSNWSPLRWAAQGTSPSTTWSAVTMGTAFTPRSFDIPPGAVSVRARMSGGATGPHVVQIQLSSALFGERALVNGGSMQVAGPVGHATAVSGNPFLAGVEGRSTDQAAVASGQASRLVGSLLGKGVVLPYALPGQVVDGVATMTNTSDTAVLAAQGAGIRSYLTSVIIANETAANLIVAIKDGTTVKQRVPVPANGGVVVSLPVPLRGSANTAWNLACLSSPGGNVYGSVVGFTAAE